jgi:hypothetical protein
MGIPATEFTFEDGVQIQKMSGTRLRLKLDTMWQQKQRLGLLGSVTETTLLRQGINVSGNFPWIVTFPLFIQRIFNIHLNEGAEEVNPKTVVELKGLFDLFKERDVELERLSQGRGEDNDEKMDLRAYCFLDFVLFCPDGTDFDQIIRLVFRVRMILLLIKMKACFKVFLIKRNCEI